MANDYDLLIIGGGLAGMTAAMYGAQYGLKTGLIERMMGGAQIINIEKIENYPGFPQGISGAELAPSVQEQAMNAGAEFIMADVARISRDGDFTMVASDAGGYRTKALIVAAGSTLRQLGIPGEQELFGRGVSQCATCDGPMFMGEVVGVAGGGDSAVDEALTLTEYCEKVLLFHRRDQLRAYEAIQERVHQHRKIEVVWNSVVEEVVGEDTVTGVRVRNVITNLENAVKLSGLFVFVGLEPNSSVVEGVVKVDNAGHIPVNVSMETEAPGIFAAGDIRQRSVSQLASAVGDGATAAISAFNYIRGKSW